MLEIRGTRSRWATRAAAFSAAALLVACGHSAKPGQGSAATPEAVVARPVRTSVVRQEAGGLPVTVPGMVRARERASLASRFAATVVEIPFDQGQRVGKGTVLVRLDDVALRAALAAARAASEAAEADLGRTRNLLARGAATRREADAATARAAGAAAAVQAAQDDLAYAVLASPFAGTLATRRVSVGDVASPGQPLVEVEGEGGFEVVAAVDSSLVGSALPGAVIEAEVDGLPGPLTATVQAVSPAGDPTTHRFEVKARLGAVRGLRSGLFARLRFPASGGGEGSILAPVSSVVSRGGLDGVYVVSEGRARLRWVALGSRRGDSIEVRAGLSPDEELVLAPGDLFDGAPVVVEAGRAPATSAPPEVRR